MKKRIYLSILKAFDRWLQRIYEPYLAHFRAVVGYQPSILIPRKYHEKFLWRKLLDHSPLMAAFCDKLATKDYIAKRLPSLRIPETLWTGTDVSDIPAAILAQKVMIKCNHGCDYNFAWDPESSDIHEVLRITREWMSSTYGTANYEWGYTQVTPVVFVEKLISSDHCEGLLDFSVRTMDGRACLASITTRNKSAQQSMDYLDPKGRHIAFAPKVSAFQQRYSDKFGQMLDPDILTPAIFREAIEAAEVLSKGFDYARFDFLTNGQTLYAGEITVYPGSGLTLCPAAPDGEIGTDTFINASWDLRASGLLSLRQTGWRRAYAHMLRSIL